MGGTFLQLSFDTRMRRNRLSWEARLQCRQATCRKEHDANVSVHTLSSVSRNIPAQIMPTILPFSKYSRTRCCTAELLAIVSAPLAPPGTTSASNLSGPKSSGRRYVSGRIDTPREQVARVGEVSFSGVDESEATNAEVTEIPARTRVSYVITLDVTWDGVRWCLDVGGIQGRTIPFPRYHQQ